MDDISELMDLLSPAQKRLSFDRDASHFSEQRVKHPQNVVDTERIKHGLDVRTTV